MMTERNPTQLSLDDWIAELEISEAQAARGEAVPLAPILKRLHEHADRLEAELASGRRQRAVSRP